MEVITLETVITTTTEETVTAEEMALPLMNESENANSK